MFLLSGRKSVFMVMAVLLSGGCRSRGSHVKQATGAQEVPAVDAEAFYVNESTLMNPESKLAFLEAINAVALVAGTDQSGTGFLISPRYLVTSYSLVAKNPQKVDENNEIDEQKCAGLKITFGHHNPAPVLKGPEATAPAIPTPGVEMFPKHTATCRKVVLANQAYNIAILEIAMSASQSAVISPLHMSFNDPRLDKRVFVAGHPNGKVKMVAHNPTYAVNTSDIDPRRCYVYLSNAFPEDETVNENPVYSKQLPYTLLHNCGFAAGTAGSVVFDFTTFKAIGIQLLSWKESKYPFFLNGGLKDELGQPGQGEVPYWPGYAFTTMGEIRNFILSVADPAFPKEVRQVFTSQQ
jgi:hypothetical protein